MKEALISVIVPVYNTEEYLTRCVESIRNQTYRNLEIILVNDGSKDESGRLCDEFAKKDERIRVIHKENGGSSSARNAGIKVSNGEYIGFVDSDDYIESEMYERMLKAAVETNAGIVQITRNEIDTEGNILPDLCRPLENITRFSAEEFMKDLLLHVGDCSFCTKMLKRDLIICKEFPVGVLNEDFHLLVKLLAQKESVVCLPYCGYHVFYRIGSNTRKTDKNDFSRVYGDNVDNADMVYEIVKEKYPNLTEIAMRFGLYQRMDYLLHIPIKQMVKENLQYKKICAYVKKHWYDTISSKYLTKKEKVYLSLFALCPKTARKVHAFIRKK